MMWHFVHGYCRTFTSRFIRIQIKDIQKELDGNVMINEKLKEKLKEQQDTIANLRASLQKKTAG